MNELFQNDMAAYSSYLTEEKNKALYRYFGEQNHTVFIRTLSEKAKKAIIAKFANKDKFRVIAGKDRIYYLDCDYDKYYYFCGKYLINDLSNVAQILDNLFEDIDLVDEYSILSFSDDIDFIYWLFEGEGMESVIESLPDTVKDELIITALEKLM